MAIVFPAAPSVGDKYPFPGVSGVTQYEWTGDTWKAIRSSIGVGPGNAAAYNNYSWPMMDGAVDSQLTTDGLGGLTWSVPQSTFKLVHVFEPFDGVTADFSLVEAGTSTAVIPNPIENIVVFLDGSALVSGPEYVVVGSTITFATPPAIGANFYAITNVKL